MKVLLICNDFPPLNSIGAQRPYSWYRYFGQYGIDTTVITKNWSGESASPSKVIAGQDKKATVTESGAAGTIIRVPVKNLLPERMFARFGGNRFRITRKLLTFTNKVLSFPFRHFDKHAQLCREARRLLQAGKVDFIVTTAEPFILFKYGRKLSREFGIRWVADYRDGWAHNHVTSRTSRPLQRFMRSWEFIYEKKYLKQAALITTVDPYLANLLALLHHKPVRVVYNGFDGCFSASSSPEASGTLTLVHSGTLTPGQRVEFLLDVLAWLHEDRLISTGDLRVRFLGLDYYPAQRERVFRTYPALKDYIESTPRMSRREALEDCARADFLLAFTEPDYQAVYAKVYDYLAVRRPVLVLPGDKGILSDFILKARSGLEFSEEGQLRSFILESIALKRSGQIPGSPDPDEEFTGQFTRENQAGRFAAILKEFIDK